MLKDLAASALFPTEVASMLRLKCGGYVRPLRPEPLEVLAQTQISDIDFCYAVLNKVSRSFAVVIQQLPVELQDPICIFYLVLRGLDSVEDDMTFDISKKIPLLQSFADKLTDPSWHIVGVGDSPDYRVLLAHFPRVIRVFLSFSQRYQAVIADITRRMGNGMAEFATETTSIKTKAAYDLYCHYVAGLVGHGLSDLFAASGLEDASLAQQSGLSNSMGLFLQKTNIIRDYLEDLNAGRTWWPEEVWSEYVPSLGALAAEPWNPRSLACLNAMVTDALALVPDSLAYLALLRNQQIFEFCAIPQVMAMATLELCYNNIRILTSATPVKVRKGLSCKMMLHSSTQQQVHGWFHAFARRIESRIPEFDPSEARTRALVRQVKQQTQASVDQMLLGPGRMSSTALQATTLAAWGLLAGAGVYAATRHSSAQTKLALKARVAALQHGLPLRWQFKITRRMVDGIMAAAGLGGAAFLGGWMGLQFV